MGYGRHLAIVAGLLALGVAALPLFNVALDTSRVLTGDRGHIWRSTEPRDFQMVTNYRYLRVLHVIEESPRFDSFVMGSSRVGAFDVTQLGDSWYKLSFARGLPYEHLHNLEALLDAGVPVRHVMVGLDHLSFYRRQHHDAPALRLYPRAPRERLDFFYRYLYEEPTAIDISILLGEYELTETRAVIGYESVRGSDPPEGEEALRAHEAHVRTLGPYSTTLHLPAPRFEQTLQVVRDMHRLSVERGFELTVFINPFHYKNFLAMDVEEMETYKRALVEIAPFYDFSGINRYTLDNRYWKEVSHYYSVLAAVMMRVMSGEPTPAEGFGARVTEDNVDEHLAALRGRTRAHLDELLRTDPGIVLHETQP